MANHLKSCHPQDQRVAAFLFNHKKIRWHLVYTLNTNGFYFRFLNLPFSSRNF
jgi:hypothetical protein